MAEQIINKACTKCKQIKSLSDFYKDKQKRDGYTSSCKICCTSQVMQYAQTPTGYQVRMQANRKYQKSEKGKKNAQRYAQYYYGTERGKFTAKHYKQSKKGKETAARLAREYRRTHPFYAIATNAVNHAVQGGKLPRPDTLKCHYCPAQAKQYHHYLGYEPEHWLDVFPICCSCHLGFR